MGPTSPLYQDTPGNLLEDLSLNAHTSISSSSHVIFATAFGFLMAFGAGGLYPVIGTYIVESCKSNQRHTLVATLLSMQGLASFSVPLCLSLLSGHVTHLDRMGAWRWLTLLISIPLFSLMLVVAIFCEETMVHPFTDSISVNGLSSYQKWTAYSSGLCSYCRTQIRETIGACLPWMLFDYNFYENGVFLFHLGDNLESYGSGFLSRLPLLVTVLVTFAGYILSVFLIRRIPPKIMQLLGFVVLGFVSFAIGLSMYSISRISPDQDKEFVGSAVVLYDSVFRFFYFCPNLTTFMMPLESVHTSIRCGFHGVATLFARFGAVIGLILWWFGYYFPKESRTGENAAVLVVCCITAVSATFLTLSCTLHVKPYSAELKLLDSEYAPKLSAATTVFALESTNVDFPTI